MERIEPSFFPVDPDKLELRRYFNSTYPGLEVDPIELLSSVHRSTAMSLEQILIGAEIKDGVMDRVRQSIDHEFQAYLTVTGNHSEPALVIEQATNKRTAVIPAGFLTRVSDDIQLAQSASEIQVASYKNGSMDKPLHYGARLCLMYSYGLLVFEEIDPWDTLTAYSDGSDDVRSGLAATLLCTGLHKPQDLPMNVLTGYMRTVLPGKFAATLALKDLERTLFERGDTSQNEASEVAKRFVAARKAACVATRASRAFALSQADMAFEKPLSNKAFSSFIHFASELAEELHGSHEVIHAEFPRKT